MTTRELLLEELDKMDEAQQERLLGLARALARTAPVQGEPGPHLAQAARLLDDAALDEIAAAIAEGCESVDRHGWD